MAQRHTGYFKVSWNIRFISGLNYKKFSLSITQKSLMNREKWQVWTLVLLNCSDISLFTVVRQKYFIVMFDNSEFGHSINLENPERPIPLSSNLIGDTKLSNWSSQVHCLLCIYIVHSISCLIINMIKHLIATTCVRKHLIWITALESSGYNEEKQDRKFW